MRNEKYLKMHINGEKCKHKFLAHTLAKAEEINKNYIF